MRNVSFDYSKLRGRIIEKFGSIDSFSKQTSFGRTAIHQKLSGETFFNQLQILEFQMLLGIQDDEIRHYFFTIEVQKTDH